MKKYIVLTILSVGISYLMAKMIFMGYQNDSVVALSNSGEKYYFLQMGVFSNYDSMLDNTTKFPNYIYMIEDDKYYVFSCISKDMDNINKIKDYYKNIGYDNYVKEFTLADDELSKTVDKVDMILKETNEGLVELCKQSISKYKEG